MDAELVNQLNNAHARGIAASASVDATGNQAMQQIGLQAAIAQAFDMRLMNGFLADQLFNQQLVEAKSAFHTPLENSAAPLPAPPAK